MASTSWLGASLIALMLALGACARTDDGASGDDPTDDAVVASDTLTRADLSDVFGRPDEATGDPFVLAMVNLEEGPVTFPEYSAAARAAADYLNAFRGGISGRPISIAVCATDGQPATSERCARQLLEEDPVAFLGGFDPGSSASMPVIEAADLAWLGGVPTTPEVSNSDNAVIFHSLTTGDAAATAAYVGKNLSIKDAAVVYPDDPVTTTATNVIKPALEAVDVAVTMVPVPPDADDVSEHLASAVDRDPDLIFAATPNACADVVNAARDLGFQGALAGLDPCLAEPAITAAGNAMDGLYAAMPVNLFNASGRDTALFLDAMDAFAPDDTIIDAPAGVGFSSVMNIHYELDEMDDLSTAAILGRFRSGKHIDNFMANPYTCDGRQQPQATAVCNSHQRILQVTNGEPQSVGDWFSAYVNW